MEIVILITVIESLVLMLAIPYFYYKRSQSGKRALARRLTHGRYDSKQTRKDS